MDSLQMIYLPAAICLIWAAILGMTAFRMKTFRQALALMLTIGIYFMAKSRIVPGDSGIMADIALLLRETAGACIAPLAILLILRLLPGGKYRLFQAAWVIIPAVLVTGGLIISLYSLPSLRGFWFEELYLILMYVSGAVLAVFMLGCQFKADGKKKNRAGIILGWLTVALFAALLPEEPWEGWAVCPILLAIGYFLLFGTDGELSWKDLGTVMKYNAAPMAAATAAEESKAVEEETAAAGMPVHEESDGNSLLSRFQHLLLEERLFLEPGITLTEVAERLHSNKTYVSRMVNENYKVGFPELINTLRVDYAEQYILNHRDARQEEIARECGFLSASTFNNTFKNITGMPPKQWVTNWDALHK